MTISKVKSEENATDMLTKIVIKAKLEQLEHCLKMLKITDLPAKD